jgi:hypothetical protein
LIVLGGSASLWRMDGDISALASLWVAAIVALFAFLTGAEAWRTGKRLRQHQALLAGVGPGHDPSWTVAANTWQVRRDLAIGEVRERRRLRRLLRVNAVMTAVAILGMTFVLQVGSVNHAIAVAVALAH